MVLLVAAILALVPLGVSAHGYVIWLDEDTFFAVDPDHQGGQLCGQTPGGAYLEFLHSGYITGTVRVDRSGGCVYPRYSGAFNWVRLCKWVSPDGGEGWLLSCTAKTPIE